MAFGGRISNAPEFAELLVQPVSLCLFALLLERAGRDGEPGHVPAARCHKCCACRGGSRPGNVLAAGGCGSAGSVRVLEKVRECMCVCVCTEAVVRVDGEVKRSFTAKTGVRQRCVNAPTPFNVLVDDFLQEALSQLPPDKQLSVQIITESDGALPRDLISRIVALMYANDLALLADSPDDLVVLLGMVDAVALKYGMFINAAKTEIMVVG
eukprot:365507-Chlamydomonas_euryale.AAC.5